MITINPQTGKTSLSDSLIASNAIISQRQAGKVDMLHQPVVKSILCCGLMMSV